MTFEILKSLRAFFLLVSFAVLFVSFAVFLGGVPALAEEGEGAAATESDSESTEGKKAEASAVPTAADAALKTPGVASEANSEANMKKEAKEAKKKKKKEKEHHDDEHHDDEGHSGHDDHDDHDDHEHAEGDVHTHGTVTAKLAADGNKIILNLKFPQDTFVGFEHQPKNDAEKKAFAEAKGKLTSASLLSWPKGLECSEVKAEIKQESKGKHMDVHFNAEYSCKKISAGQKLTFKLGEVFSKAKVVELEQITLAGKANKAKYTKSIFEVEL